MIGGSSSLLLDAKIRRRSRNHQHRPAERPIHLRIELQRAATPRCTSPIGAGRDRSAGESARSISISALPDTERTFEIADHPLHVVIALQIEPDLGGPP